MVKLSTLISTAVLAVAISSNSIAQTKVIAATELQGGSGMFFSAVMDNLTSSITMTMSGPDDRWLGMGFGSFMADGDVLIFSNGKVGAAHALDAFDYNLTAQSGSGVNIDIQQDWLVISNTVNAGERTIVASRFLNTGDVTDNVLNFSDATVDVVWAKGETASNTIAYHGVNRGVRNLTWVDPSADISEMENDFNISIENNELTISDESGLLYDFQLISLTGEIIDESSNSVGETIIDVSTFTNKLFIVQVTNINGQFSRKFVID
mgnify:FL=1